MTCELFNDTVLLMTLDYDPFIADAKRTHMINIRSPGPYEDKYGPVIVGGIFIVSICVKLIVNMLSL